MRKSTNFLIPTALITLYYLFWIGVAAFLLARFTALRDVFPAGGIPDVGPTNGDRFEPVYSGVEDTILSRGGPFRLALASLGAGTMRMPAPASSSCRCPGCISSPAAAGRWTSRSCRRS